MKRHSKIYAALFASFIASATMSSNAHAQGQPPHPHFPILACIFEKDCHSCVVKLQWEREEDGDDNNNSNNSSTNDDEGHKKVLTVKCDGETIYDGKAFTASTWIKHDADFAVSVISAINNYKPDYPSVSVDGNIDDYKHGFVDDHARLRFNGDDVWLGRCVHFGLRQDNEPNGPGPSKL